MIVRPLDLMTLINFAEQCGALIVPDENDGPEIILDADAFEKFTDQLFQFGLDFGLQCAQDIVDRTKAGGGE